MIIKNLLSILQQCSDFSAREAIVNTVLSILNAIPTFKNEWPKTMLRNSNGIKNKTYELSTFIKQHNVNIIPLGERRVNFKHKFSIPNFHVYHTDHPANPNHSPAGRTAILIRRDIVHNSIPIPTDIDSTMIHVKPESWLCTRARCNTKVTWLRNTDESQRLFRDLNAKHTNWHCPLPNKTGRTLVRHEESANTYQTVVFESPINYQYIAFHRPDVFDKALLKLPSHSLFLTNHNDLSSDHNLQIINISAQSVTYGPPRSQQMHKVEQIWCRNH